MSPICCAPYKFCEFQALPVNQLIQAQVQVLLNCFGLFFTTGGNFGKERDKCLIDEEMLDGVTVLAGRVRDGSTNRRWDQIEEECRLTNETACRRTLPER